MEESVVKTPQRVGVIIGRFQTPDLHAGHRHLFEEVCKQSDILVVLLGSSAAINTIEDPMPYGVRNQMVSQYLAFGCDIPWTVREIPNHPDNSVWSKNVDAMLTSQKSNALWLTDMNDAEITLYGGRDSFIKVYDGVFTTVEVPEAIIISATEERKAVRPICSSQFRQGMVHAANIRYPQVFPTVDVAILNRIHTKVLLGRKPGETAWRFPGGFVDPTDDSFEAAAIREAREETGLDLCFVRHLGSMRIDDWRYRGRDKIMTTFFTACATTLPESAVKAVAGDDLEEVKWFVISRDIPMMPAHKPLLEVLLKYVKL